MGGKMGEHSKTYFFIDVAGLSVKPKRKLSN